MGDLLLSADAMAGGSPEPTFGPAPPPLAGPELPSFRFPLGSLPTKTFNGGTAKEATVAEFPMSEKLAGVYMTLEPGGLRELHWHANAAEWAYVIEGRCRVTTIDPQNQREIVDFGPGEVWFFPRGHGHSIQGLGRGTCTFVLVFDNGYFSEFGTFSITDWLGHSRLTSSPRPSICLLRPSPTSPRRRSISQPGRCRRLLPRSLRRARSMRRRSPTATSCSRSVLINSQAARSTVSENEFPISTTMTGALLIIQPGALRELHWHPNAAEWQFYLKGSGRMTVFGSHGRARTDEFAAGDVGYVPQGYGHYIENTGSEDLEVVLVLNNATYQSVSITAWIAANPDLLLATNFGVPESVFAKFPKGALIMPK
jgi:oxalate decarboxylase